MCVPLRPRVRRFDRPIRRALTLSRLARQYRAFRATLVLHSTKIPLSVTNAASVSSSPVVTVPRLFDASCLMHYSALGRLPVRYTSWEWCLRHSRVIHRATISSSFVSDTKPQIVPITIVERLVNLRSQPIDDRLVFSFFFSCRWEIYLATCSLFFFCLIFILLFQSLRVFRLLTNVNHTSSVFMLIIFSLLLILRS